MTLEQENDAIQKKLGKVTKELEKVKKEAVGWSCADIGHAPSVGPITRTKLAATASTSTLHAARKSALRGSPGACLDGRPVRAR